MKADSLEYVHTDKANDSTDVTFSHPPFSTLDPRLLSALADLGFAHPTLVQAKAIPLLLDAKDVLAKARTGSGKTAAYAIPGVQKVLRLKEALSPASSEYQATRMIVLVPTRELAMQVTGFLKSLTKYCEMTVLNASAGGALQRMLQDKPDIIVATPSNLGSADLSQICFLAIDEADLLLSYGHKEDLMRIVGRLPKLGVQGCLVSATLSEDLDGIKSLTLRNPVCPATILFLPQAILTLSEPTSLLTQYYTLTSEKDKFLLIYVLLKLKLVRGKSIVFVNDIERGYRLKLFLNHFGVKACVVNSELPLASRYHVVEEFNRGIYDVVVATDESVDEEDYVEAGPSRGRSQGKKRNRRDTMARGIDFTSASSVINFDLPTSADAYKHRVGRTARAGQSGMALSFVVPRKLWGKDRQVLLKTAEKDEEVLEVIKAADDGAELKEWDWGGRKGEVEGFRYRMEDALRSATAKRVQEARKEEVRRELLNSEKLKAHFAANPLDLAYLRHDTSLHPARQHSHLKHVPSYLMPKIAAAPLSEDVADSAAVGFKKQDRGDRSAKRGARRKAEPLKFR